MISIGDDGKFMKKKGKKHPLFYKSNPSSQLLIEDTLKIMLNKSKGLGYKTVKNKMAPRNKHSVFGDFPKDFLASKKETFELPPIDSHQVSSNYKLDYDNSTLSKKIRSNTSSKYTKPPVSGAFQPRKIETSSFRLHYDRGDLPIIIQHSKGYKILWKGLDDKSDEPLDANRLYNYFETFDFQLYLPIFVDGIRETTDPYRFLAIQGTFYLLDNIGDAILKVISQLIIPLKKALNTRDPDIIIITLKVWFILNNILLILYFIICFIYPFR